MLLLAIASVFMGQKGWGPMGSVFGLKNHGGGRPSCRQGELEPFRQRSTAAQCVTDEACAVIRDVIAHGPSMIIATIMRLVVSTVYASLCVDSH